MIVCKRLLLPILLFFVLNTEAQELQPFKSGDRVAFVGNSITDGGHYHSYIWLYYMTHFPKEKMVFFNCGIGGDVVGQMYTRFQEDVLSKKPNVISLTWGMNDTKYFEWRKPDGADFMAKDIQNSYDNYNKLQQVLLQNTNIRKIFIGGSPYDETTKSNKQNYFPGKSKLFDKVIDFQYRSAQSHHWGFVDFYHPMLAIEKKNQEKDSMFSLTPNDRIHPDNDGHMVMAYLFLKSQQLANKPIADIVIDAKDANVTSQVNCIVSNTSIRNTIVSFDYLASSLPYPSDTLARGWGNNKSQAEGLQYVPFEKEFDQELLTIKNLQNGEYQLKIDGRNIGTWRSDVLSEGINLALLKNTPQYQQALQVAILNEERWGIERQLRMYEWMKWNALVPNKIYDSELPSVMDSVRKYAETNPFVKGNLENFSQSRFKNVRDARENEMKVLVDKIYSINIPVKHRITLERIK